MITILEGPDAVGKSTFISGYKGHFTEAKSHRFGVLKDPFKTYHRFLLKELGNTPSQHLVLDRFYPSELVYGPIFRGGSKLHRGEIALLDRILLSFSPLVVRANLPIDEALFNFRYSQVSQLPENEEAYKKVYKGYQRLDLNLPSTTYSYLTDGPFSSIIHTRFNNARGFPNVGPGGGYFKKGNALVVGGDPKLASYSLGIPFVGESEEAYQLAELLKDSAHSEGDLYWVYPFVKPWFVHLLEPRFIIAVGEDAEAWVHGNSVWEMAPSVLYVDNLENLAYAIKHFIPPRYKKPETLKANLGS